jgi:hypothetical protein
MVIDLLAIGFVALLLSVLVVATVRRNATPAMAVSGFALALCLVALASVVRYGVIRQERDPYGVVLLCEGHLELEGRALDRCIDNRDASHAARLATPWLTPAAATGIAGYILLGRAKRRAERT